MVNILLSQNLAKLIKIKVRVNSIVQETLNMLLWNKEDVNCTVFIRLDRNLSFGVGRVIHRYGRHVIILNPKEMDFFPWQTVRHELLHVFLKSKIKSKFKKYIMYLPVSNSYKSQAFRENLEEYIVRGLNNLFLSRINRETWYKKQINREIEQGFILMPKVAQFIKQWQLQKKSFTRNVFIDLIYYLKNQ